MQNRGDGSKTAVMSEEEQIIAHLKGDSTDAAFADKDIVNAIKMIIMAEFGGDDVEANLDAMVLRYNLAGREVAAAAGMLLRKYVKRHYWQGVRQLMRQFGLEASVNEGRIKGLINAVTADRGGANGQQGGALDRVKGWVDSLKV